MILSSTEEIVSSKKQIGDNHITHSGPGPIAFKICIFHVTLNFEKSLILLIKAHF